MRIPALGIVCLLLLLVQTLGVCQVTAQIEWSDVYTADKLPDEAGWGASKGANTSSEITLRACTLGTPGRPTRSFIATADAGRPSRTAGPWRKRP